MTKKHVNGFITFLNEENGIMHIAEDTPTNRRKLLKILKNKRKRTISWFEKIMNKLEDK